MGIHGLTSWLNRKCPIIIMPPIEGNEQTLISMGIKVDNLYLDMNEIIYKYANLEDSLALKNEDDIIESVWQCINDIFSIVRPRRLFYMAVDGIAPKAKMHDQRVGLYRYAKDHPSSENKGFTKCDIKPGTKFMSKLSSKLRSYINDRINTESTWKSLIVVLSDANAPGEGEHKIMDFIRTQRSYTSQETHVLFSTDSDMILLGLTLHSDSILVMRRKKNEAEAYEFINLGLLRREINDILTKDLPPSEDRKLERIIDDWIFMCFLAGNDFLPNLPFIEFYKDQNIESLMNFYKENVLKENGHLIEHMKPNLRYLKMLLTHIGKKDENEVMSLLNQNSTSSTTFSLDEIKKQQPVTEPLKLKFGPPSFQRAKNPSTDKKNEDSASATTTTRKSATSSDTNRSYNSDWYRIKFGFKQDELQKSPTDVAENYAQSLCWMLHYYHKGVPSWDWYYSYYYPPLASTLSQLESIPNDFNQNSQPLKPFEEMMATFPSDYARYLPEKWQQLMVDMKSPIFDLYRSDPPHDTYGKVDEYLYIIKLAFFDEQRLFQALQTIDLTLSEEETIRNREDVNRLFIHSAHPYYQQFSNMYENNENETQLTKNMNGWIMPEDTTNRQNNQVLCVKYRSR